MNYLNNRVPFFLLIPLLLVLNACSIFDRYSGDKYTAEVIPIANVQYKKAIDEVRLNDQIPRSLGGDGKLKSIGIYDWTSGFWAGDLWYMFELTQDFYWKERAEEFTQKLDKIQYWTGNHDVGFMINCSYGNGLKYHPEYKHVIINSANSLVKRYMPNAHCIKSWDKNISWYGDYMYGAVTIDNMMNLELLFKASELSGNPKYKKIAIEHANATMKNHYRKDFSAFHIVSYDVNTGTIIRKETTQGFADSTSWARGQSWGLYGYVMCYRETHDKKYLDFAEHIAHYLMEHPNMPKDHIPYWDYYAGDSRFTPLWSYRASDFKIQPRDVSAATIMASALIELSTYTDNSHYLTFARSILSSLRSSKYRSTNDESNYFILKESVGSVPHGSDVGVAINYADYYYLEALIRNQKILSHTPLF